MTERRLEKLSGGCKECVRSWVEATDKKRYKGREKWHQQFLKE